MIRCLTIAMSLCLMFLTADLAAQEWTRFRGPNGTGASDAKMPSNWTEKDYAWRVKLPGIGHSSSVHWGDRLFITSADPADATQHILCLNSKNGATHWKQSFALKRYHLHDRNSFASSTPAVDADHVYFVSASSEKITLRALSHEGKPVWDISLGAFSSQHGYGTSPMLYKDLVILGNEQMGKSFLVAVDRASGKIRWKTSRPFRRTAYGVPCVYKPDGGAEQLIFNSGKNGITSVDPKNGKVNWGLSDLFDKRSVSSPIVVGDLIFGSCGSGGGGNYVVAVEPPGKPGRAKPTLAYKIGRQAPYVPTPIANGDLVFLWYDKGFVTCLDGPSGKIHWRERVGGNYSGSPICADDKLYCISEAGTVHVLAAAKTYQLLGRVDLGESSRSTPSIAGGRMFLRTYSHLMAIDGK